MVPRERNAAVAAVSPAGTFALPPPKRSKLERNTFALTALFIAVVAYLIWFTDGRIVTEPWEVIMQFEAPGNPPRDAGLNCQNPKNTKTPYCMERQAAIEAEWRSISRYHRGKGNAFTYH